MSLMLDHTEDFELISENKEKFKSARWNVLKRVGGEKEYQTRFKALYSKTGIYFLAECADSEITSTLKNERGRSLYRGCSRILCSAGQEISCIFGV